MSLTKSLLGTPRSHRKSLQKKTEDLQAVRENQFAVGPVVCQTFPMELSHMESFGFRILQHVGDTPSMATCDFCELKFFVPRKFFSDPHIAERILRRMFDQHNCKTTVLSFRRVS